MVRSFSYPRDMRIPEGSWLVTEIAVGGELVPPLEGARLTLEVSGDRVGGSAGVNRFVGQVSEEGFGPLATTRRAGSPDLMDQERLFLSHLDEIDSVESDGKEMVLLVSGIVVVSLAPLNSEGGNPQRVENV